MTLVKLACVFQQHRHMRVGISLRGKNIKTQCLLTCINRRVGKNPFQDHSPWVPQSVRLSARQEVVLGPSLSCQQCVFIETRE